MDYKSDVLKRPLSRDVDDTNCRLLSIMKTCFVVSKLSHGYNLMKVLSSIFRTFRNHLVVVPPNVACSSTFSDPTQTARCI